MTPDEVRQAIAELNLDPFVACTKTPLRLLAFLAQRELDRMEAEHCHACVGGMFVPNPPPRGMSEQEKNVNCACGWSGPLSLANNHNCPGGTQVHQP